MTIFLNTPSPDDPNHILNRAYLPPIENTPQPITVKIDFVDEGAWVTLLKQDVAIIKFNLNDYETQKNLEIVLNGLLKAGIIYGEMENIRDLINECKQGMEHDR